MNGPHLTVRAIRFFSSASVVDQEDPDDDESHTDGLDDGGGMENEADGDLDCEDDDDKPSEDEGAI